MCAGSRPGPAELFFALKKDRKLIRINKSVKQQWNRITPVAGAARPGGCKHGLLVCVRGKVKDC